MSNKSITLHRMSVLAVVLSAAVVAPAASWGADTTTDRGYEQVTPPGKEFGFGQTGLEIAVSARDGGAAAFNTFGPMPGSTSGTFENFYLGRRAASGWGYSPISPPQDPIPGGTNYPVTQGFSADLSRTVVKTANPTLTPDAAPDIANLYLRDNDHGTYRLLTTVPGSPQLSPFATLGGASDDFEHVVFEAQDPLLPGSPELGNVGVYEWVDGELRNAGVLPNGDPAPAAILGAGALALNRVTHAVSNDGRRVVFWSEGQLYVRTDGTDTAHVSASRRTPPDPNGPREALFWGATADGGKIFFTSSEALTDDANTGTDELGDPTAAGNDLYEYDVASDELTDLSISSNAADAAAGAAVQGMVGTSEDGDYVYFVALGALDGAAVSGSPNLYLRHGGEVRFVATLDPSDASAWGLVASGAAGLTSRLTPDGRFLVFTSVAPLTGYDNVDPSTGMPQSQVYRYAADSGELRCLSCRPDGTPPTGASTISPPDYQLNVTRNVSDDGRRVFFDSLDGILGKDTNGRRDVYEHVDGSLHLLSTGTSRFDASFQDASASGDDVLFATRGQLVPQDVDEHVDLYDARAGGGFPPPDESAECSGDDCGAPPASTPPPGVVPGSAQLRGRGDVASGRARFTLRPVSAAQRRRASRTGRLRIAVGVSRPGKVTAVLRTRVGRRGRKLPPRRVSVVAGKGGVVHLTLRLGPTARRALADRRRLRLRLTVTYSRDPGAKRTTLLLHA